MKINLNKNMFTEKEYMLLSHGKLKVFAFKYTSGIEALRIENEKGYFIILPFKGQQIWKLHFADRDLSMKTTIKEPTASEEYLKNYGGFLYHCGINSFGLPDATHLRHGEIPNAAYDVAYLICGEDLNRKYVSVCGELNYDKAFTKKYRFSPKCTLFENESIVKLGITLENLRHETMEYMYLCHINFLPQNGSRLIYSAFKDKEHIKVHDTPANSFDEEKNKKLSEFIKKLKENPGAADEIGSPDEMFDPEICFAVKYAETPEKRGYTLAYKKGGGACYVSHPTDALPVGVRWISRTADEDALGMILPATSEHLGYEYSKKHGYLKYLPPMGILNFEIEFGYLEEDNAIRMIDKINKILS